MRAYFKYLLTWLQAVRGSGLLLESLHSVQTNHTLFLSCVVKSRGLRIHRARFSEITQQ